MKPPFHVLSVASTLAFGGDESRLLSIVRSLDLKKFRCSIALLPQNPDDATEYRNASNSSSADPR